ncbi:hypothetical protein CYD30_09125 [Kosakonia cowanii]|nr:hypothetical protein EH164_14520 [Kosakonia sp. CCTCC M2018092]QAR46835.1 hypothetical protein EQG67_14220 [Kosakonia cowanii]TNL10933.1 hypothetical protein CYD30_09125 [Kosakonia cowanii]TPD69498.1 hypothetical protein FJP70_03335 [Kosakonia cowanii]TPD92534.1 hypothetical protein FJP67_03335 [Kosakonia cowanii]
MAFRAHCYKNVADRAFPSEKINILRGAFVATGIDWNRNQQKMLKVFYDTTATSQIPPRLPCAGLPD